MKKIGKLRAFLSVLMTLLTGWMIFSPTAQALRALPETYRLSVEQIYEMDMGAAVLSSQDEKLDLKEHTLSAREKGEAEVSLNLFGLFPIGKMLVQAGDEQRLMPGGEAVGVALATKGVLIIGVSDVSGKSPAQSAGLRHGCLFPAAGFPYGGLVHQGIADIEEKTANRHFDLLLRVVE